MLTQPHIKLYRYTCLKDQFSTSVSFQRYLTLRELQLPCSCWGNNDKSSQESIKLRRLFHIFVFWEENRCLIIYINYAKCKAFTVTRHLATDMNEEANWLVMLSIRAVPASTAMAVGLSVFSC